MQKQSKIAKSRKQTEESGLSKPNTAIMNLVHVKKPASKGLETHDKMLIVQQLKTYMLENERYFTGLCRT